MGNIVVFCGSNGGKDKIFEQAAYQAGAFLAESGIGVVYGGGKTGMMGALAESALEKGGRVIGVIPRFMLKKGLARDGLTELVVTEGMLDRKKKMSKLAEAAIALPGGFGTMDELFEMLTGAQLGLYRHPVGLLNVNNFYGKLLEQMDVMASLGFLKAEHRKMLVDSERVDDLIGKMNFKSLFHTEF